MTITVRELAAELDVSADTVRVYVDQLIGVDGEDAVIEATAAITNATGRVTGTEVYLTESAAAAVREANGVADDTGWDHWHLHDIMAAAAEVEAARAVVKEKEAARDELIRRAAAADVKRSKLWEAAGITEPRLSQILRGPGVR